MTQQEWEALNATMGYSPELDASIRKSVQQATTNGATVPPGYQNLLPSVASWMPGEEQSNIFNSPEYGEVDAFGYDAIDSASTGVLNKYSSEVNDPSSNVNKVEVKKHNADGTVTTTTTENKTNTPSFKGTKDKDKDKMRVPMTNAGGMTVIATSPEEVAMYQNNGYVAPNTENDALAGNYYGDEAVMVGDSDIFDQAEFGDTEWGGRNTTPKTMYHPSGFSQVITEPEASLFLRDGYFNTEAEATEDRDAQAAFDLASAEQDFFDNQWDAEEASLANTPSWLGKSDGAISDAERDELTAQDQSILPNQSFEWQGKGEGPMTDAEREKANNQKEVAKSEVGQAVVKEFQQRVAAGANPDAEVKKFLQSAEPLKEWRPKLFKAILGTLIGLAGGDSLGAAAQAGFGVVGEDIAAEEKVAAEIAKEERKTASTIEVERAKLGLKSGANKAKAARESVEKGEAFAFKMVDKLRATLPTDKKGLYTNIDASKVIGGLGKLGSLYPSINWFQPQSQVVSQARMQGLSEWSAYVQKSVDSGNTAKIPPESFIEAQFVRNKYVGTFGKEGKKKITIPRSYFGNDVEQTIKTANIVNTEWAMAKSSGAPTFNNAKFSQEAMWRLYAANFQAYLKTAEGKAFNKKNKIGGFEKWVQQNPRGYIIK